MDIELVAELDRGYTAVLDRLIPSGSHVVLLDYPTHRNIGDHLIWLGETQYLGRRDDLAVDYISDRFGYSHRSLARHLSKQSIVLLHGGGNFGDLYAPVQVMRESIVAHFPSHRFIQLPQTVSFRDGASAAATATALRRHGDFTLLVRDHHSMEFAKKNLFCEVELCCDAAFLLGMQPRSAQSDVPIMWIARRDEEGVSRPDDLPSAPEVFDWEDVSPDQGAWLRQYRRQRVAASVLAGMRQIGLPLNNISSKTLTHAYDRSSWLYAQAGFRQLSRAEVLVTDRLHGHIMALMLGIPHVLLDDARSKVRHFYETWTHAASHIAWADGPPEAYARAQGLLSGGRVIST